MKSSLFSFRFLSYLVYAVLLTGILLYVRFPADKFRTYCEQRLEHLVGSKRCTIAEIHYLFPASVEFEKVRIGQSEDRKSDRIIFDRLTVSPGANGFLSSWKLAGKMYSGSFAASLELKMKEKVFHLNSIILENGALSAMIAEMPSFEREIGGKMSISGEYTAEFDEPMKGTGNGKLHLGKGSMQLVREVLTLEKIDFDELNVLWKYRDSLITLAGGKMVGPMLNADFTGTLQPPFLPPEGRLNITGFLVAKKQFLKDRPQIERLVQRLARKNKGSVPFRLNGTMEKPTFRLST